MDRAGAAARAEPLAPVALAGIAPLHRPLIGRNARGPQLRSPPIRVPGAHQAGETRIAHAGPAFGTARRFCHARRQRRLLAPAARGRPHSAFTAIAFARARKTPGVARAGLAAAEARADPAARASPRSARPATSLLLFSAATATDLAAALGLRETSARDQATVPLSVLFVPGPSVSVVGLFGFGVRWSAASVVCTVTATTAFAVMCPMNTDARAMQ